MSCKSEPAVKPSTHHELPLSPEQNKHREQHEQLDDAVNRIQTCEVNKDGNEEGFDCDKCANSTMLDYKNIHENINEIVRYSEDLILSDDELLKVLHAAVVCEQSAVQLIKMRKKLISMMEIYREQESGKCASLLKECKAAMDSKVFRVKPIQENCANSGVFSQVDKTLPEHSPLPIPAVLGMITQTLNFSIPPPSTPPSVSRRSDIATMPEAPVSHYRRPLPLTISMNLPPPVIFDPLQFLNKTPGVRCFKSTLPSQNRYRRVNAPYLAHSASHRKGFRGTK